MVARAVPCVSFVRSGLILLILAAGNAPSFATEVQGNSGWLVISGAMHEIPCRMVMSSAQQIIDLPVLGSNDLQRPGDVAEPTSFSLQLEGCSRKAGTLMNVQNNTLAWSSQQPLATLTFFGLADSYAPDLFQVKGAKGIDLRLWDASGQVLRPGIAGTPLFLTPGDNKLKFTVAPVRTPTELVPSAFRTTLDFQIYYQ